MQDLIKKLSFEIDKEKAKFDEAIETNDKLGKIKNRLESPLKAELINPHFSKSFVKFMWQLTKNIKGDKGDRGERGISGRDGRDGIDGKTPIAGIDFQIPVPKNGKDGKDGKDADEEKIIKKVLEILPKPKDGIDGKDAIIPDIEEIAKKTVEVIKGLKGNDRIDISNIKNSEQFLYGKGKIDMNDQRWHGGGSGNMFNNVLTITSSTTLPISGGIFFIDASAGPITLNLPTANGQLGYVYKIKKVDTSANTVTIEPYGSETIDDDPNIDVADYNNAPELVSDNNSWKIM